MYDAIIFKNKGKRNKRKTAYAVVEI